MRLALVPLCLAALPLCAQWDLRLELPRPSGQSLPQTLLSGTGQLVAGDLSTGSGFLASANRQLFQVGPLLKFEGGLEYSQLSADGSLSKGTAAQGTKLKQKGVGLGLNAQVWVPFVGLAGTFAKERFTLRFPGQPVIGRFAELLDLLPASRAVAAG